MNPRSGRPEPNPRWGPARFNNWIFALFAAGQFVGAVWAYQRFEDFTFALPLVFTASLFALLAFAGNRSLMRRRAAYYTALERYEAIFGKDPA